MTCGNRGVVPWLDLHNDILSLVMMRLGIIDFLAFSGVCKSWRSLALSKRNKFIVSRPPMPISISTYGEEKECYLYLEDFEGRKFKTIVPHSVDRTCIGVTGSGYLILFSKKSKDFWLVNPITRHELHLPYVPYAVYGRHENINIKGILVFSSSISEWVFVMLNIYTSKLWLCVVGERRWTRVCGSLLMYDIHAFKGKIYMFHASYLSNQKESLYEIILHPKPKLMPPMLLDTKNFSGICFSRPQFVSSSENLYVIDRKLGHPYRIHELDFAEMKWVLRENTGEKYAFFLGKYWKSGASSQYMRYANTDKTREGKFFHASMWYFFHDFLDANLIHE